MDRPTFAGARGGQLPNLRYFGLRWKEAQKYLDEHAKLRERMRAAGREQVAVREEIRRLENDHHHQRVVALRNGDGEPDTRAIDKAKAREKKLQERIQGFRQAAEMVDADLYAAVTAGREKWLPELEQRRNKAAARREELLQELRAVEFDLQATQSLEEWLQEPERSIALGPAPVSSVA